MLSAWKASKLNLLEAGEVNAAIANQRELDSSPRPIVAASCTGPKVRRSSFTTGLVALLGGQIACAAVAVVIEICYARFLGPAGRGQVSLCLMAIYTLALLAGLGGEIPITTWAADPMRRPKGWFSSVLLCGLIGSIATGAIWAVVFWEWHPRFLRGITSPLAALVLAAVPVTVLIGYFNAALMGHEQFRAGAILSFAAQVAELAGVGILLLIFGRTAEMALLGYAFGLLSGVVIAAVILRKFLRGVWTSLPSVRSLVAALSFGVRGQLGNVATLFNYRLDVFIVNYFLNPAQVGLYTLGVVISESLWQIPRAVAVALLPRTARTIYEGATEFTCAVTRQVLVIACLSGLAIAVASPLAIPLLFGARFSPSVSVIWWILPGTISLSLAKVMSADLAARGKPEYSSICAFLSLAVTVVLDFTLIPWMGIRGAALASSIAYLVHTVLVAIALKRVLGVSWKFLLVPSYAEWTAYKQAWLRMKAWLRPTSIQPPASETNAGP
jgi:O-antigen/teichoic acid export membrane protein